MTVLKSFLLNTTSTIQSFLSKYVVAILGGALGISLLSNGFLVWRLNSAVEKKVECVAAVENTIKTATQAKVRIEKRQERVTNDSSNSINRRIANANASLQNRRGWISNTPVLPGGTPGTTPAGETTIILPRREYEQDVVTCTENTILLEEWQDWYKNTKEIYEDETIEPKRGIFSLGGGAGDGSLQGLSRGVDMGLGSYEQFGPRSLPPVQGQPPVNREVLGSLPLVDGEEVPSSGAGSLP